MNILKLKFIIIFLPLLFWSCESGQSTASGNNQNNKAKTNQAKQANSNSMMIIQQGTVGKVGKFSVGVRNADSSSAHIAVWNPALPQTDRNDFNVNFTVKAGESVPIGNDFYLVANVSAEEIQIESEPDKTTGINLQETNLAVPVGGIVELHKFSVEVVSIESAGGKDSAKVEIYSNDYPKKDLEAKNEVRKITVSTGDEISIGDKKHKVSAVHAAKGNARGVLEIAL